MSETCGINLPETLETVEATETRETAAEVVEAVCDSEIPETCGMDLLLMHLCCPPYRTPPPPYRHWVEIITSGVETTETEIVNRDRDRGRDQERDEHGSPLGRWRDSPRDTRDYREFRGSHYEASADHRERDWERDRDHEREREPYHGHSDGRGGPSSYRPNSSSLHPLPPYPPSQGYRSGSYGSSYGGGEPGEPLPDRWSSVSKGGSSSGMSPSSIPRRYAYRDYGLDRDTRDAREMQEMLRGGDQHLESHGPKATRESRDMRDGHSSREGASTTTGGTHSLPNQADPRDFRDYHDHHHEQMEPWEAREGRGIGRDHLRERHDLSRDTMRDLSDPSYSRDLHTSATALAPASSIPLHRMQSSTGSSYSQLPVTPVHPSALLSDASHPLPPLTSSSNVPPHGEFFPGSAPPLSRGISFAYMEDRQGQDSPLGSGQRIASGPRHGGALSAVRSVDIEAPSTPLSGRSGQGRTHSPAAALNGPPSKWPVVEELDVFAQELKRLRAEEVKHVNDLCRLRFEQSRVSGDVNRFELQIEYLQTELESHEKAMVAMKTASVLM
ncbi:hypothetical protein BASA62_007016 [Batrachochytrium salamandrivorans]|nr:hypothetical protein BASA62_007016 [Batrachochytrium salamandrivorans]